VSICECVHARVRVCVAGVVCCCVQAGSHKHACMGTLGGARMGSAVASQLVGAVVTTRCCA